MFGDLISFESLENYAVFLFHTKVVSERDAQVGVIDIPLVQSETEAMTSRTDDIKSTVDDFLFRVCTKLTSGIIF